MKPQYRPRLTESEIRFLLYLIKQQEECFTLFPETYRRESKALEDQHYLGLRICKWLRRKFTKLLQPDRFAKPGLLGFLAQGAVDNYFQAIEDRKQELAEREAKLKRDEQRGVLVTDKLYLSNRP